MRFKFLYPVIGSIILSQGVLAKPLEGRKYGVEFNIPRLLLSTTPEMKGLSGTFSYFYHFNSTEIALPWLIAKYGADHDEVINTKVGSYKEDKTPLVNKSIDLHYRKYISDELNGLYFSGFTRLSHFDGARYIDGSNIKTKRFNKLRIGFGVGIGYRILPNNGRTYWGVGLIVGRYIDNKSYSLVNNGVSATDDSPIIIDAELLKFGYSF